MPSVTERFRACVQEGNCGELRRLLDSSEEARRLIDQPLFPFGAPAIVHAAANDNGPLIRLLLDYGADIDAHSEWSCGGFSALHYAVVNMSELAWELIEAGADVDAHAAAGLGMLDRLEELFRADPAIIHQRGPDGQLPLHFAYSEDVVDWLLDHGADIDATCLDHGSTAAQWAIRKRPEVTRYLIERGARADIFLAAALGDRELADRLIDDDPTCLEARLGEPGYGPVGPRSVLCWLLGHFQDYGDRGTPHVVAHGMGHRALFEHLCARSEPMTAFLAYCEVADGEGARRLLARHPDLRDAMTDEHHRLLANHAWNNNVAQVRLMLDLGFDPHVRGDHASTPLDRASFHGFADVIAALLEADPEPPLDWVNDFGGMPLGTLLYGARHGWRTDGDYPRSAALLLDAGAPVPPRYRYYAPRILHEVMERHGHGPHPYSRPRRVSSPPPAEAQMGQLVVELPEEPVEADHSYQPRHQDDRGYRWRYPLTLRNAGDADLRIEWFDVFILVDGWWIPYNHRWKPFEGADFAELFGMESDVLPAGAAATWREALHDAQNVQGTTMKWVFRARRPDGQLVYAEGLVRGAPVIGDLDTDMVDRLAASA